MNNLGQFRKDRLQKVMFDSDGLRRGSATMCASALLVLLSSIRRPPAHIWRRRFVFSVNPSLIHNLIEQQRVGRGGHTAGTRQRGEPGGGRRRGHGPIRLMNSETPTTTRTTTSSSSGHRMTQGQAHTLSEAPGSASRPRTENNSDKTTSSSSSRRVGRRTGREGQRPVAEEGSSSVKLLSWDGGDWVWEGVGWVKKPDIIVKSFRIRNETTN